jgi:ribosome-binding protein aMBF1 (putative translation factor)
MSANIQDWNPVTIHGKSAPSKLSTRPKVSNEAAHLAKIEREDFVKSKVLSNESKQALIQARVAQKLTQVELDRKCSFPPHTINAFESGKLTPSNGQMNILSRVLKITLKLE